MNRIIQFRVWDTNEDCWRENCEISQNGIITSSWGKEKYDWILQPFTGLKDKNGKEIYEGDVLCIPENDPYSTSGNALVVVEFRYGTFGYVDTFVQKFEPIYDVIGYSNIDDSAEIIGNIFETPELLK